MRLSPAVQCGLVLAVVLTSCLFGSYFAFGGGDRGVPMATSLSRGRCGWLVGALVVSALLLGVLGVACPSLFPIGAAETTSLALPPGVRAEGFANETDNENLFDALAADATLRHAIASPFALDQHANPTNDAYVITQSGCAPLGPDDTQDVYGPGGTQQRPPTLGPGGTQQRPPTLGPGGTQQHPARLTVPGIVAGGTYVLRVWVGMPANSKARALLEANTLRPFDLRFVTSGADDQPVAATTDRGRIIGGRSIGDHTWYHLETSAPVTLPMDASKVFWFVGTNADGTTLADAILWAGFHVTTYREGASDMPVTQGLSALYHAFDGDTSWSDRSGSGYNAVRADGASAATLSTDGGVVFTGKMYGPPASVLGRTATNHTPTSTSCAADTMSRENVGPFTIAFVYARGTKDTGVRRLLRVPADHFARDDGDVRSPNSLVDVHVDHGNGELLVRQYHRGNDGTWAPAEVRVKLHADVAVYTMVHDGTRGLRIYANATEVATEAEWFDRHYQLGAHRMVWNDDQAVTLYAFAAFRRMLSADDVRRLAKYLMRKYNEVDDGTGSWSGSGTGYGSASGSGGADTTMELVELRAQMAAMQDKLKLAENTSAGDPVPGFYASTSGMADQSYDPYGQPTDHTNLNTYVGRVRGIRGQLNALRVQEAALLRQMPPLVVGTRVVVVASDQEAVVSRDQYSETDVAYVHVDYADGSETDVRVRVSSVRLPGGDADSGPQRCHRDRACGEGRFCNYDRLDTPGEGTCEPCDTIVACDRSFHVDTKTSCEAQCPTTAHGSGGGGADSQATALCDAKTPCATGSYCNFENGDYGYCDACDTEVDDLCDDPELTRKGRRQCRRRCLSKEQTPYQYRSDMTDEAYAALSTDEKQNVLQDQTWNRSVRSFAPLSGDTTDFEPFPHRHHSDGSVTAADTYDGHHEHGHGHGQARK